MQLRRKTMNVKLCMSRLVLLWYDRIQL